MPYFSIDEFAAEHDFNRSEIRNFISEGMPSETLQGSPKVFVIDQDEAIQWLEDRDLVEDVDEDLDEDELDEDDELEEDED